MQARAGANQRPGSAGTYAMMLRADRRGEKEEVAKCYFGRRQTLHRAFFYPGPYSGPAAVFIVFDAILHRKAINDIITVHVRQIGIAYAM